MASLVTSAKFCKSLESLAEGGKGEVFRLPSRRFTEAEAMRSALYLGKTYPRELRHIRESVHIRVDQYFEDIDFYDTAFRKDGDGSQYKSEYLFINCHFYRCVFEDNARFYHARHCTFDECAGLKLDSYGDLSRDMYSFCAKIGGVYEGSSGLRDKKRV